MRVKGLVLGVIFAAFPRGFIIRLLLLKFDRLGVRMRVKGLVLGVIFAAVPRGFIIRLLLLKFDRDVKKLNSGDHSSLLAAYGDNFVFELPWRRSSLGW
jgi:hypothetical protein